MTIKTMIMSLGGSPEPLIKSIDYHQPGLIIFLASHDSVRMAGEIFSNSHDKPAAEFEITDDPNLMYECYKAARRCVDRVRRKNLPPEDVIVDYTGGTKVMTAALILATIGLPYHFNYVGGGMRNKNGLGAVVVGHEMMFPEMSPWSVFAEEERRQVITLLNGRRYSAVIQILDLCNRELPHQINAFFLFVRPLAFGFLNWEQFNHKVALDCLQKGAAQLAEYLRLYPDEGFRLFAEKIDQCVQFLKSLLEGTKGMSQFHVILVEDLLNNARRRMADKRYDDAAARIYRALELYGQICFEKAMHCSTDKVKANILPDAIRDEFIRKYQDPKSKLIKLPLQATYEVLRAVGDEAGARFYKYEEEIKKIQHSRNYSILAHGIQPVGEKAAHSIFETVKEFVQIKTFVDFPLL